MQRPNFSFEKKYWKKGYKIVIGVDEVGRGSFAGPVVAGATSIRYSAKKADRQELSINNKRRNKIVLNTKYLILNTIRKLGIDDSKRLTPIRREQLVPEIKKHFYFAVGQASVADINRLGIVKATEKAMRKAVNGIRYKVLSIKYEGKSLKNPKMESLIHDSIFLLVDAFHVKYISGVGLKNQLAVKHGDRRSISIAAASIIAKVHRDSLMLKYAKNLRFYHFDKNKGYGTRQHCQMIKKHGICRLHRKLFVRNWI